MDFDREKQYFFKILNNNYNFNRVQLRHIEESFSVIDYLINNPGKHSTDEIFKGIGLERF